MKYVELRTRPTGESARPGDDPSSTVRRSRCSAANEQRDCRRIEEKEGRQTMMSLTSCELGEVNQTLPVVQPEDLLDEGGELHRTAILRSVVREVVAEELPRQHPTVVQQRTEPEEEDPDAVVTRPGTGHELGLLVGVGVLNAPALLVSADDALGALLVVERPVGTTSLPKDARNVVNVQNVGLVTVREGIEALLRLADDGLEVVLVGVVPIGLRDDTDLLREVVLGGGNRVVLVVVEPTVHCRESAFEFVTASLQSDGGRDIALAAQLEDARRLEPGVKPERFDGDVLIGLFEKALNEVVRSDVLRVGFDRDGDVLVVLLVVDDQGCEVEAVGRSVLRLALAVPLCWAVGLRPVRDDCDIDVGVQVPLEHPSTSSGTQEPAVDTLELLVPADGVALFDGVEGCLDGEVVAVVVDDVRRTVTFLSSFEERREDTSGLVRSVSRTVEVCLFEHDCSNVADLLVLRLFGDLRQRLGVALDIVRGEERFGQVVREPGLETVTNVLGVTLEVGRVVPELLAHRVGERGVIEVLFEAEGVPDRRVPVEVELQFVIRAAGQDGVDVGLSNGLRLFSAISIEPILTFGCEGSGRVSDSLRDGLLTKSRFGLRAGAAGHAYKNLSAIEKSSANGGASA